MEYLDGYPNIRLIQLKGDMEIAQFITDLDGA